MKQKVLKNCVVCWECDQRRNKFACKAKLHVLDDQIIKVTNRLQRFARKSKSRQRDRGNASAIQYLRGLAHNISMWRTLLLMFRLYANPNGIFFQNHQPTRGYTGNHCTIRKLCLKNETQKFYSGGYCPGGFCLGGFLSEEFCRGYMSRGFLSLGVVLEPSSLLHINRFFGYCFVWGLFW